ncbi:MAG TPA: hypothetical protein VNF74_03795 [Terriglobales bacterium]|nr:hypothetical protein [Terriglobales bacterium]
MNLTIKDLPEEVGRVLKRTASERGRSLNREVVRLLSQAAAEAERRRGMRATRTALERFVASLPPLTSSVPLVREDRQHR